MIDNDTNLKYKLIFQHVVDKIRSGELKEGDKLQSEDEMCSLFNVSRITVRKALSELVQEGFIVKKHSKGSFVKAPMATMRLDALQGFTEEMRRRGMVASAQVLKTSLIDADSFLAEKLNINLNAKVYCIERLRLADNEPMAIERGYVPYYLCPELGQHDLTKSLYSIFISKYKMTPIRADQILEATLAKKREAQLLHIETKAAILKIERISYLSNNVILEYVDSSYRADRYKFYAALDRRG